MITLKNVTLRRGTKVVLDSVSTTINPGENVGLVGRNGAGKSSLFALLSGKLHEDGGDFHIPSSWRMAEVAQNMPETDQSATDFVLEGDTRLAEVQQQLVAYMEQHVPYTKNVGTGGYLTQVHLNDPYTGFLKGSNYYKHTRWEIDGNTDIAIFNNIEHDDDRHQQVAKDTAYRLLVRLTSGRIGVVTEQSKRSLTTPLIKVFFSTKSNMRIVPVMLDLSHPSATERIQQREDPNKWNFPDINELWSGLSHLGR